MSAGSAVQLVRVDCPHGRAGRFLFDADGWTTTVDQAQTVPVDVAAPQAMSDEEVAIYLQAGGPVRLRYRVTCRACRVDVVMTHDQLQQVLDPLVAAGALGRTPSVSMSLALLAAAAGRAVVS